MSPSDTAKKQARRRVIIARNYCHRRFATVKVWILCSILAREISYSKKCLLLSLNFNTNKKLCKTEGSPSNLRCPHMCSDVCRLSEDWQCVYRMHCVSAFACTTLEETSWFQLMRHDREILRLAAHETCHREILRLDSSSCGIYQMYTIHKTHPRSCAQTQRRSRPFCRLQVRLLLLGFLAVFVSSIYQH